MTPNQSAVLKVVAIFGVLSLIAYTTKERWDEGMRIEAARMEAERETELELAAVQREVLASLGKGDIEKVRELIDACIKTGRGPTVSYMLPDRKDPRKVREYLKGQAGYDLSQMLAYIELPVIENEAFFLMVAERALERQADTGALTLEFAVTYEMEGFAGMKTGWGIMTCPLRGGQPQEPDIKQLYME
jgi:hypothetical protein